MANDFLKPKVIAATALGLLERELKLASTVWTDAVSDFDGKLGDTVTIRIPARTKARRRTLRAVGAGRQIVMDELHETGVDVKLTTDVYNAVPVTDEELTLDISNFGEQILSPQVRAIAEDFEDGLVECMQDGTYAQTVELIPGAMYDGSVDVRQAMQDRNVPAAQRIMVVGSAIEAAFLKDPLFVKVNESGSDSALRDAVIGRTAGFTVLQSNALAPDEGYAYHRTAYISATRAPKVPDGAAFGQSTSYAGLAMRWLRDYDFLSTTDRSLVDTYVGFTAVADGEDRRAGGGADERGKVVRAVKLSLGEAVTAG